MGDLQAGIYERLITGGVEAQLAGITTELIARESLDPSDADAVLARHLADLAGRALRSLPAHDSSDPRSLLERQVDLANTIARTVLETAPAVTDELDLIAAGERLTEVMTTPSTPGLPRRTERPTVPLGTSALLVNGRDQPRIGSEVQKELASADRVDLLCAFVMWHGLRVIEEQIASLIERRRIPVCQGEVRHLRYPSI